MKHLFASYEIALALKEKGFNEECITYYVDNYLTLCHDTDYNFTNIFCEKLGKKTEQNLISAPLYQQVIDFFREKHGIIITINAESSQLDFSKGWNWSIWNWNTGAEDWSDPNAPSGEYITNDYHTCFNLAITEALKLI